MSRVTITFDNGPEPGVTETVLDALAQAKVKSTFFVIGQKVALPAGRRLVERAHAEGHKIGNHTYTHSLPLGFSDDPQNPEIEIGRTQALIADLAPEKLFRPFGRRGQIGSHLLSPAATDYLVNGGFTCVIWNALAADWIEPDHLGWVERALTACAKHEWSVLALHDLPTGAMDRLPEFLAKLRDAGTEIRQDFPETCLPIISGRITPLLDVILALAPASE
jgi:peptidoglycan/xylan/chitin deacetylase (PgdA/CDA1 family)